MEHSTVILEYINDSLLCFPIKSKFHNLERLWIMEFFAVHSVIPAFLVVLNNTNLQGFLTNVNR